MINQTFAPTALSVLYDGVSPANWGRDLSARRALKAAAASAEAARLRGAKPASVTTPLTDLPDPDNFINSTFSAQLSQPWAAADGSTRAQLVIRAVNVFNANATVSVDVRGLANTTTTQSAAGVATAIRSAVSSEQAGHEGPAADHGALPVAGGQSGAVFSGEQWLLVAGNPNTWNTPSQPTVSAIFKLTLSELRRCDGTAVRRATGGMSCI